uniref:Uncharacterized protein n=1 Tax=Rhizophora mucronata TaxID=61149 RepID=A0A2P2QYF7_RHIMU
MHNLDMWNPKSLNCMMQIHLNSPVNQGYPPFFSTTVH